MYKFATKLNNMNKSFKILLALTVLISASCKKKEDPDTTLPVAVIHKPTVDEVFSPGGKMEFVAVATDDRELSQLQAEIHSEEDNHKHESSRNASWETRRDFDLSGRVHSISHTFEIPADADTGAYHIVVYVLDRAGNKGTLVERDFSIATQ